MKTNVSLWLSRHQTFSFWEIHFFSCLTDNVQTKFEMGEDAKERRKKIRKKRRKRQILSLFSSKIKFH
jgi:hypothetical protein